MTIAIGTAGMNLLDLISVEDRAGTSMGQADSQEIWENMFVEAGPNFYVEHQAPARQQYPAVFYAGLYSPAGNCRVTHTRRAVYGTT